MRSLRLGCLALISLVAFASREAKAQDDDPMECVGLSEGAVCTSAEGEQGTCKRRDDGTGDLYCDAEGVDDGATAAATGTGGAAGDTGPNGSGTDDGGDVPGRACAFSPSDGTSSTPFLFAVLAVVLATRRRDASAAST